MRRPHILAGAAVLLLLAAAGAWYVLSPGWTLKAMVDAARAGDEARFSSYVDYPALRDDMKGEVTRRLQREAKRDGSAEAQLGLAMGMAMLGPIVDQMVSPKAMKIAFSKLAGEQGGKSKGGGSGKAKTLPDIRRDGPNRFLVVGKDNPDAGLVFERSGLGWKLTGIDLPAGTTVEASRK